MLPGMRRRATAISIAELLRPRASRAQPGEADADAVSSIALRARAARGSQGAFSFVLMDERTSSACATRTASGRSCSGGSRAAGCSRARPRPSTSSARTSCASVEPGEMVVIDANGPRSLRPFAEPLEPRLCLFEFVYFARPDTRLYGQSVHGARQRMGEELAEQAPVDADMVMPRARVGHPRRARATPARSGIPYGDGLVKNRYVGRTFIQPSQELRALGVRLKLNPLPREHRGQAAGRGRRLDRAGHHDSGRWSAMLREAGAAEVHFRVSSPPYRWPCFYGMDTGTRGELLAADMSVGEIRDYLGVDSLAYLDLDRLIAATGAPGAGVLHRVPLRRLPGRRCRSRLHKSVLELASPQHRGSSAIRPRPTDCSRPKTANGAPVAGRIETRWPRPTKPRASTSPRAKKPSS